MAACLKIEDPLAVLMVVAKELFQQASAKYEELNQNMSFSNNPFYLHAYKIQPQWMSNRGLFLNW